VYFRGVVEEVREDLLETAWVALRRDGLVRQVERQAMSRLVDDRPRRLDANARRASIRRPLRAKLDLAARDRETSSRSSIKRVMCST
jgi:hypothetical protein